MLDLQARFGNSGGADADDEQALILGLEMMYSMCGNNGQIAIIDKGADAYFDWGMAAVEEENSEDSYEEYVDTIYQAVEDGDGQYDATDLIWEQGFYQIESQYGKHDNFDEYGEGTGR